MKDITMKTIRYVGTFDAVEIEPDPKGAPNDWVTVAHGDTVDVAASRADGFLAQTGTWEPVGTPKTGRKPSASTTPDPVEGD